MTSEPAKIRFQPSGERYIVMLGDDRAGFVRKKPNGKWNAADTSMSKIRDFPTRRAAGVWLRSEAESAIRRGEL